MYINLHFWHPKLGFFSERFWRKKTQFWHRIMFKIGFFFLKKTPILNIYCDVQSWGFFKIGVFFKIPSKKTPILNMTINVQNWGFFQKTPNFEHLLSCSKLVVFLKGFWKNPQFWYRKINEKSKSKIGGFSKSLRSYVFLF